MARSIIGYFDKDFDKNYCEYYSCCHTFPCPRKVLLHKNHDFKLRIDPHREDVKYAVSIRHPYDSLLSYYAGFGQSKPAKFFKVKARYWVRFVEKWVLADYLNHATFEYKHTINNYTTELSRMIKFFWPEHEIDVKKIEWLKENLRSETYAKKQMYKGVSLKHKRTDWKCNTKEMQKLTMSITGETLRKAEEKLGFAL